eukprot:CAMPEP_0182541986 /NCGR_PEP_ID=MMETSP1323-20130603/29460_1 /TAXON_ID=236787 /ORGANISM="Florenciella parvula, Strain RCC1693" /LENGTH=59 /DNA_ID=CAMNT_0024752803 /DNA_START=46 /DNA_END=221 /DNA_ORIENTATION=+
MGCSSSSNARPNDDMDLPISVSTYDTPFFKEYQFDHSSGKDVLLGKGGFSKVLRGVKKG